MSKETLLYAFPQHTLEPNPNGGEPRIIWQEGMTLRDYFAAKAMQGILAGWNSGIPSSGDVAPAAYSFADAMLKAREE